MNAPVLCTWDGESFVPRARFGKLCDKQFVVGEEYPLVVNEERSGQSHRHYFASVTDGWRNLPVDVSEDFPTSEHLRKYALIKAGFCDRRSIVCASKAEAQRVAAFIKPMDDFAVVTVSEAVVTVYTARSQSQRAMGRKEFQASKVAVLDIIAAMIGSTPAAIHNNARSAA